MFTVDVKQQYNNNNSGTLDLTTWCLVTPIFTAFTVTRLNRIDARTALKGHAKIMSLMSLRIFNKFCRIFQSPAELKYVEKVCIYIINTNFLVTIELKLNSMRTRAANRSKSKCLYSCSTTVLVTYTTGV